jgi:hypothetical protein
VRAPKHNNAKPHCFLTRCSLNLEARQTNVEVHCAWPATGVARVRWEKDNPAVPKPGRPWANCPLPDGSGIEPESEVTKLALKSSALDRCSTQEAQS